MKDKKLQIFISSTFTDLQDERQAAVQAVLSCGHIPAGMELFSAGDESQMAVIKRWIDESDVYMLILGGRYGSIEKTSGKSYTHLEYEYALEIKKPLFAVVISPNALDEKVKKYGTAVIEQESSKELIKFKEIVQGNLVKFWDDPKDIKIAILETIADFEYRKELTGWIRGDNSVNTAFLAEELAKLANENFELRSKLDNDSSTLYASLRYSELEELLKREKVKYSGLDFNLFDYFVLVAETITESTIFANNEKEALDKLEKYKLVKGIVKENNRGKYKLTEDGHNFYLKSLVLKQ